MASEKTDERSARLVSNYAVRIRGLVASQHEGDSVYSPLGVWVLLAAAAVGASGELRDRLEAVVGCCAHDAGRLLEELLREPPPALALAVALWSRGDVSTKALSDWARQLPRETQIGPLPSQEDADAWTRRSTLDLIQRLPVSVEELSACLVSAVATRVSWEEPFEVADADRALSAASPWHGTVAQMLRADRPMSAAIIDTDQAGIVAALEARAQEGLSVICVSARPDVPRTDVLDAAAEIAAHVRGDGQLTGCSLFDLTVGDGHSWSLTERSRRTVTDGQRFEHISQAFLPAWSIQSSVSLLADERFGAGVAIGVLEAATGLSGPGDARQDAVASFDRYGFEAAAVTAMDFAASGSAPLTEMGVERVAELRFDHPFAAIAVGATSACGARWAGLPMFEAWVTSPTEPEPERERPEPPEGAW